MIIRKMVMILLVALATGCQASPTSSTVLDLDFKYQGEYIGKTETDSTVLGAQVVAKGGGQFSVAFLTGGLPGNGWDTVSRVEQNGSRQSTTVHFTVVSPAKEFVADISADGEILSGKNPQGKNFSLKKIIRKSPTLGQPPPSNATTLFNGVDLTAFETGTAILSDSLLLPQGSASSGATTLKKFGDFALHLEFLEPYMPSSSGLERGNSGVYLQGRFELQVLDSFGLNLLRGGEGPATQECGAFYQLARPKLNMSFPPLSWQTYDVEFTSAKFDVQGKNIIDTAVVTVRLNGVAIHDHQKLRSNTLLGDAVTATTGPLRFQAHGDPVYYRNIWVAENVGTGVKPALKKRVGVGRGKAKALTVANGRSIVTGAGYGVYLGL